jgi:small redox-active disulfide protein 2
MIANKKIKVLGTGCPKCNILIENVEKALQELGLNNDIEKVTDIDKITEHGVMMTPALVIGDEVIFSGQVPNVAELSDIICSAICDNDGNCNCKKDDTQKDKVAHECSCGGCC